MGLFGRTSFARSLTVSSISGLYRTQVSVTLRMFQINSVPDIFVCARKTPSRTWKNKKMHGHMGGDRVTTLNMLVYYVDPVSASRRSKPSRARRGHASPLLCRRPSCLRRAQVNHLIVVKGAVPGCSGGYVFLRDAVRLKQHTHNQTLAPPVPTAPPPRSPEDLAVTSCPPSHFTNPFAVE